MIVVPEAFAAGTLGREGPTAQTWLDALPERVGAYCEHWGLHVAGPVMHGYVGLVVPVRDGAGGRCVLKLSWPGPGPRHEPAALRAWDGDGAVRLLAEDDSPHGQVLLLEWLDPNRTLALVGEVEACAVIGDLLRRLRVPAPAGLSELVDIRAEELAAAEREWSRLGRPLSRRCLDAAITGWTELSGSGPRTLLHDDLHHFNVLAGEREPWLAIDPQPCVGDPASGVLPALRNRFDVVRAAARPEAELRARLRRVCEAAELDENRARRWAQARATLGVLWMLALPEPESGSGPRLADVLAIAEWLAD